jgi:hypothetical protein
MNEPDILSVRYNMNQQPGRKDWYLGNLSGAYHTVQLNNWFDKTNILIQYDPGLNNSPTLTASGTLSPDATGTYQIFEGYAEYATYVRDDQRFFIWSKGYHYYITQTPVGDLSGPYWMTDSLLVDGDYQPYNGATGVLTITVNYATEYIISGTLSPDATGHYAQSGTYNDKPLYVRDDEAYRIYWDGFWWTIVDTIDTPSCEWRGVPFVIGPCQDYQNMGSTEGIATVEPVE